MYTTIVSSFSLPFTNVTFLLYDSVTFFNVHISFPITAFFFFTIKKNLMKITYFKENKVYLTRKNGVAIMMLDTEHEATT